MVSTLEKNQPYAIAEESISAGEALLDHMPFPVMRIATDYRIEWMNRFAKEVYGPKTGCCYGVSHAYERPCNFHGEQCPKLQAELSGEPTSVLHVHTTQKGQERFKVVAVPLAGGGVLEWHIPIDDIGAIDCVTGLLTRSETQLSIDRTIALMERMNSPFAVLMLDIDHFKVVNDRYGHPVGDVVLGRISQLIAQELRKSDVLGRWGGEEFLALLPNVDMEGAAVISNRILMAVRTATISNEVADVSVTLSGGLCWIPSNECGKHQFDRLVGQADAYLYRAKNKGRDRLEVCECG